MKRLHRFLAKYQPAAEPVLAEVRKKFHTKLAGIGATPAEIREWARIKVAKRERKKGSRSRPAPRVA